MIGNIFASSPLIQIVLLLLGFVVLISGRRLFWLTVAVVGFITGLILAFVLLDEQPLWLVAAAALITGGAGALIAILLQKVAVGVAGFLMGGYALLWLGQLFGFDVGPWQWVVYIIGGITGAILVSTLLEYALIGLSALIGASIIVQIVLINFAVLTTNDFGPWLVVVFFFALLLVGIVVQAQRLNRRAG